MGLRHVEGSLRGSSLRLHKPLAARGLRCKTHTSSAHAAYHAVPFDLNFIPFGKQTVCELEHGPVEIVSFSMKNGGSFHSYVNVYQAG